MFWTVSLLTGQPDTLVFADKSRISLLFMGDIMGHDSQIHSAYHKENDAYFYEFCFKYISPIIKDADIAVANLELTLAGKPFKGYPSFSSPVALAEACKKSGIDLLMTANNHCYDRLKKGFERTINVLDSLGIMHTGTFKNFKEKKEKYPLIVEKNNIRLAVLNYTYGTNGINVRSPNIVNYIDKKNIADDIAVAERHDADIIIIYFHWGIQYKSVPDSSQINLKEYCFSKGADIIIGSHPHVIQKIEWQRNLKSSKIVVYSLGNFLSNQRQRKRDGGMMIGITIVKNKNRTYIEDAGYYLTWVYTPKIYGRKEFYIIPVSKFEKRYDYFYPSSFKKMSMFIQDARKLLKEQNFNIDEYLFDYSAGKWKK